MTDRACSSVEHPPRAECEGCQWTDTAPGALGRAAQHHDRTGHVIRIELTRTVTYGDQDEALRAAGQTTMLDRVIYGDEDQPC